MNKEDFKVKTAAELQTMLAEHQARLGQLRFDLADKKLKRTSDIEVTRRTIARILTALKSAK
jgi:ribosomal protein L29